MDAQHEYDGPTINGRPIATVELIAAWCGEAKIEYDEYSSEGIIEIARALNHALLMGHCWNEEFEPIRRLGPHWAPRPIRGRGRPMRLDNNLAASIRQIAAKTFPGNYKQNIDTFILLAMRWLGVERDDEKGGKTLARASRRRRHASVE